jgi:hypothetical protein
MCLGGMPGAGIPRDGVLSMDTSAANRGHLHSRVEQILSLSDEQTAAMVPVAGGGVFFTGCPNCAYGAQEAGCFGETWNPRLPGRLVCKGCGNVVQVEPVSGGARLHVREKPAFSVTEGRTRITSYPQREIDGTALRFSLPRLVSWNTVPIPP